jgi:hypothetical protein
MCRRTITMLVLCLGVCSVALGQSATIVFELEAFGDFDSVTIVAATQILRDELNATGKFSVIPKAEVESKAIQSGIADVLCRDMDCAVTIGEAVGAKCGIMGTLTSWGGQSIQASIRRIDLRSKKMSFSDKFEAASLDDLNHALGRLARAVATGKHILTEKGRYNVDPGETVAGRRKAPYVTSGLAFGFGAPSGDSYSKVDNLKSLSWVFRYEVGHFVLANSIGFCWGKGGEDSLLVGSSYLSISERKARIVPWDILVHYVVNRKADFSPFVGAGAGFQFIFPQEVDGSSDEYTQSDQALALHLSAGLYAFQSYNIRLVVESRYTTLMTKAFGEESGDSSKQLGLYMGIAYRL